MLGVINVSFFMSSRELWGYLHSDFLGEWAWFSWENEYTWPSQIKKSFGAYVIWLWSG